MSSSNKVLALGLFLGAAAGACYATYLGSQQRLGRALKPHAAPVEVQTWEGEGGAVPVRGSKTARETSPVPMPTSPPEMGSSTTH